MYLENDAYESGYVCGKRLYGRYKNEIDQNKKLKKMKQKVEIKDEEIGKLVKGFSEINKIGIPLQISI